MKHDALLVELFTEELPPKSLKRLGDSFAQSIFQCLSQDHLVNQSATSQSFASPRRLAVLISVVLEQAPDYPVREKLLPVRNSYPPQLHLTKMVKQVRPYKRNWRAWVMPTPLLSS